MPKHFGGHATANCEKEVKNRRVLSLVLNDRSHFDNNVYITTDGRRFQVRVTATGEHSVAK